MTEYDDDDDDDAYVDDSYYSCTYGKSYLDSKNMPRSYFSFSLVITGNLHDIVRFLN
jgi:hypothetical protein